MKRLAAIGLALLIVGGCNSSSEPALSDADPTPTAAADDGAGSDATTDDSPTDDAEPAEATPTPEFPFDPDALPEGADAPAVAGFMAQFGLDQETAVCVIDEIGLDDPESIDTERFADLSAEICGMTMGQLLGVTPR